jgi:hypothetical protein
MLSTIAAALGLEKDDGKNNFERVKTFALRVGQVARLDEVPKPLPPGLIATVHGVCMILLLTMIVYVNFFDIKRATRGSRSSPPPAQTATDKQ